VFKVQAIHEKLKIGRVVPPNWGDEGDEKQGDES